MYKNGVDELTGSEANFVHSTRLKEHILARFPDLGSYKEGREVLLAFNDDVSIALKIACDSNPDSDALCLMKAANLVRKDMKRVENHFTGLFKENYQSDSAPKPLLAWTSIILNDPNIPSDPESIFNSQPNLSLAQLLLYNRCSRVSL